MQVGFSFHSFKQKGEMTQCTWSALKVMPPILLCWPTTPEVNVGGMVAEAEPPQSCPVIFWCRGTDSSTGTAWHSGVWYGNVHGAKGRHWISPWRKKGPHWHSLNTYGYKFTDVSTVMQWVVQQQHERQAMFWAAVHSCHTTDEEQLNQLIHTIQLMVVTTLKNSVS